MIGTFLKTAAVTVVAGASALVGVALASDAYEAAREGMVGPRKDPKVRMSVEEKTASKKKAKARRSKPAAKLAKNAKNAKKAA